MIEVLKPSVKKKKVSDFSKEFVFEPLERGFGHTFGNSLRRVLLSSLPGAAVTSVKIDGVSHEFATLKGLKEDVIDMLMNLKKLVVKLHSDEPATIRLQVKGAKKVTAADFELPAEVELVNPDLGIANLNKEGQLKMECIIENGRGYATSEGNKKSSMPIGTIAVDSIFSPVKRVSYNVEHTRVGQQTDYDKLVLKVETDGSTEPEEALAMASRIINDHMNLLVEEASAESIFVSAETEDLDLANKPVEDMDLSVRSYNCLKKANIDTLGQLIQTKEADLMSVKNFGKKSIDEIKEKLEEMELSLKEG
jgi:DNA-directed RNA polymerase subunit alpha